MRLGPSALPIPLLIADDPFLTLTGNATILSGLLPVLLYNSDSQPVGYAPFEGRTMGNQNNDKEAFAFM